MLFKKITDKIYYLPADSEDYRPVTLAIMGKEQTLIVDAGATPDQVSYIQKALEELDRKADYLVLTHSHWDHSFGLAYWPDDTITISHEKTLGHLEYQSRLDWNDDALYGRMEREEESEFFARMIKRAYPELEEIQIALPKKYYASEEIIDLGGIEVELHYLPSDHADDNTLIYIPQEKFLFTGDVLAENIKGESWFYTYHKLASAIDRLKQFNPEMVCESHGEPINHILFLDILEQLEKVNETVRSAVDKGNPDAAEEMLENLMGRPLVEDEIELIRSCMYGYFVS